ncbi:unnamed protein product [Ostreobium quekettii]|uniref:Uncharacterized protein n=1 Tax=Ostreobium quekettii TaxID=121088 RepID=A0A8S1IKU8_9CHLO|nr:unnamed protein product [Ostreobium quekettii]
MELGSRLCCGVGSTTMHRLRQPPHSPTQCTPMHWLLLADHAKIESLRRSLVDDVAVCVPVLQVVKDSDFVSSVLSSLPGVDPEDPMVKSAVENLQGSRKDEEQGEDGKDNDSKGQKSTKKDKKDEGHSS